MRRLLVLFLVTALGGLEVEGAAVGKKETARDEAPTPKPRSRRVLFRTDSPRLFAPSVAKPAPRVTIRRTVEVMKPAKVASAAPARVQPRTMTPAAPSPARLPAMEPRLTSSETVTAPSSFAIEFHSTSFTPYDRYMGTVRRVISSLSARRSSMVTACDLVREGRRFRYVATDPYRAQPPSETDARRAGDCKAKALWLYDHLGDPEAFYVIGKLQHRSRTSHAWVYWRHGGRWWILDPTDRATPIAADTVAKNRYVPYYSYSRAGSFRHPATRIMVASNGGTGFSAVAVRGQRR